MGWLTRIPQIRVRWGAAKRRCSCPAVGRVAADLALATDGNPELGRLRNDDGTGSSTEVNVGHRYGVSAGAEAADGGRCLAIAPLIRVRRPTTRA